jgi:hypothetical protein
LDDSTCVAADGSSLFGAAVASLAAFSGCRASTEATAFSSGGGDPFVVVGRVIAVMAFTHETIAGFVLP